MYKVDELIYANQFCKKNKKILNLHLPINTGMNRLGVNVNEIENILLIIGNLDYINLSCVYTHFYSSDIKIISNQYKLFSDSVNISKKYYNNISSHYISSNFINYSFNKLTETEYVRIGMANYTNNDKSIIDCIDLYSRIIDIRRVNKGDTIGYNNEYKANNDEKIAVCSGGYFDGILCCFSGLNTIINGKLCKIVGKICMDVFFVNVTNVECKINDKVTILSSKYNDVSLNNLSKYTDLSTYEILASFKGRIKTIYQNNTL